MHCCVPISNTPRRKYKAPKSKAQPGPDTATICKSRCSLCQTRCTLVYQTQHSASVWYADFRHGGRHLGIRRYMISFHNVFFFIFKHVSWIFSTLLLDNFFLQLQGPKITFIPCWHKSQISSRQKHKIVEVSAFHLHQHRNRQPMMVKRRKLLPVAVCELPTYIWKIQSETHWQNKSSQNKYTCMSALHVVQWCLIQQWDLDLWPFSTRLILADPSAEWSKKAFPALSNQPYEIDVLLIGKILFY